MSGNGHHGRPPIPMPSGVPIIGQPCKFKGWLPVVQLQCSCDAEEPLLIIGQGAVTQCPACHRQFTVSAITWKAGSAPNILIGLVMNPKESLGAPEVPKP